MADDLEGTMPKMFVADVVDGVANDLEGTVPKMFEAGVVDALTAGKGLKADELSSTGNAAIGIGLAGSKPNENELVEAKAKNESEARGMASAASRA